MRERGIILSPWEVRAFLDNRKQRLMRIVKPQPVHLYGDGKHSKYEWRGGLYSPEMYPANSSMLKRCPLGQPGDRLWGRETWAVGSIYDGVAARDIPECGVRYAATQSRSGIKDRSPVTMPRWASRILLEVTEVRVQRVQDMTETEAMQEGVDRTNGHPIRGALLGAGPCFREGVAQALEDVSPGAWDRNDWAFIAMVKRLEVDRG